MKKVEQSAENSFLPSTETQGTSTESGTRDSSSTTTNNKIISNTAATVVSAISELKNLVTSLVSRISDMEKIIRDQDEKINHLISVTVLKQSTQAVPSNVSCRSYAEALRLPATVSSTQVDSATHESAKEKLKVPLVPTDDKRTRPGRSGNHDVKISGKHDVKSSASSVRDVTSGVVERECGSERPVVILHDSVLHGVMEKRLGESYGFDAVKCEAYNISNLEPAFKSVQSKVPPKAVVVHCGINNLKNQDPRSASKEFIQAIKNISSSCPTTKIVVSKLPVVSDTKLQQKKELFNAVVFAELVEQQQVSFVNNDNLPSHALRDIVHPNKRGSSILAGNIGRHVHRILWEKPRRPARRLNRANHFPGHYDWKGNFYPHSPIHFPTRWY